MRALSMRIVTYLIEYLGEFEFIFETILDYESGPRWVLLMQKNRHRKSHAWAPLRFSKFFFLAGGHIFAKSAARTLIFLK
jgi:hypothetical protein